MSRSIEGLVVEFDIHLYRQAHPLSKCFIITLPGEQHIEQAGYAVWEAHGAVLSRRAFLIGVDSVNIPHRWYAPFLENGNIIRKAVISPALPHLLEAAKDLSRYNQPITPILPMLSFAYPQNTSDPIPPQTHPRAAMVPVILDALIPSHILTRDLFLSEGPGPIRDQVPKYMKLP